MANISGEMFYEEINNKVKAVEPLFLKENRLATFNTWVFESNKPCSAENLAEAGFIFFGTKQDPDTVKCFFCEKTFDGWEENDSPWFEHKSHAPDCEYAKLRKSDLTFEEYLTLRSELLIRTKNKALEQKMWPILELLKYRQFEIKTAYDNLKNSLNSRCY